MRALTLLGLIFLPAAVQAADFNVLPVPSSGITAIIVQGPIVPGDDDLFYDLSKQVDRAIVVLDSPGGDVETGLSIASEIYLRRFDTSVGDGHGCYSMCAIIWVSGARRYMTPGSTIGVHAAYREQDLAGSGTVQMESGEGNADIGAYLNEIGLSRGAIRYFASAPPDQVNLVTPEIAQRLDIDVFLETGAALATPEDRPTPRRIAWQMSNITRLSARCSELLGLNPAQLESQARLILQNGHDMFGGDVFIDLIGEFAGATRDEMSQMGTIAWCVAAERALRNDGVATGVTSPSFDCAKASTQTEQAICSSSDLWTLDRAVSNFYFLLKASFDGNQPSNFLQAQRNWNERRDLCGANQSCLIDGYAARLSDMVQYLP